MLRKRFPLPQMQTVLLHLLLCQKKLGDDSLARLECKFPFAPSKSSDFYRFLSSLECWWTMPQQVSECRVLGFGECIPCIDLLCSGCPQKLLVMGCCGVVRRLVATVAVRSLKTLLGFSVIRPPRNCAGIQNGEKCKRHSVNRSNGFQWIHPEIWHAYWMW